MSGATLLTCEGCGFQATKRNHNFKFVKDTDKIIKPLCESCYNELLDENERGIISED